MFTAGDLGADGGSDLGAEQLDGEHDVAVLAVTDGELEQDALVAEASEDKVAQYAALALAALDQSEPGKAFGEFLTRGDGNAAGRPRLRRRADHGVSAHAGCEQRRRRSYEAIARLIARAKDAGALRPDYVAEDIVLVLLAQAGVVVGGGAAMSSPGGSRHCCSRRSGWNRKVSCRLHRRAGRVYHALMELHDEKSSAR